MRSVFSKMAVIAVTCYPGAPGQYVSGLSHIELCKARWFLNLIIRRNELFKGLPYNNSDPS